MKVQYYAHSSFLFTDERGVRILTDPFSPDLGYPIPNCRADITLISHNHFDHANLEFVLGKTEVVQGCGTREADGVTFHGILADHDGEGGRERGKVVLYTFTLDGMRIAYLSDLGCPLTEEQRKTIGPVDVLFLPVGGHSTIGPAEAHEVRAQLNPKVTVPMHYLTGQLDRTRFPLKGVDAFTTGRRNVRTVRDGEWSVTPQTLPKDPEILVLTNVC